MEMKDPTLAMKNDLEALGIFERRVIKHSEIKSGMIFTCDVRHPWENRGVRIFIKGETTISTHMLWRIKPGQATERKPFLELSISPIGNEVFVARDIMWAMKDVIDLAEVVPACKTLQQTSELNAQKTPFYPLTTTQRNGPRPASVKVVIPRDKSERIAVMMTINGKQYRPSTLTSERLNEMLYGKTFQIGISCEPSLFNGRGTEISAQFTARGLNMREITPSAAATPEDVEALPLM